MYTCIFIRTPIEHDSKTKKKDGGEAETRTERERGTNRQRSADSIYLSMDY